MSCKDNVSEFGKNLIRKKPVPRNPLHSDLLRCLGLVDLTYLSIGAMIGVGIYVTMGQITREAGPSIVLSYLLGGVTSVLSALCYAELAARIPIAGSSYQFTYMTMGEFWGFFVGWNIALEHAIGSAAISRAVSGYIDSLFGDVIRKYLSAHLPMPGGFLATYPDFLAVGYVLMITTLVALGIKLSSRTNIFFASLNFIICSFIIVSAMILGEGTNWVDAHHGGFFPHGFSATLSGAATLIFAYIGYEVVGAAAEEAENPRRNIPLSLIISIFGVMCIYTSVAASFVSLVPWYNASVSAPFSDVYVDHGWYWAKYIITVGIIVASTAANIAATIAIPRYLFSMARDGLIMQCFAIVNKRTDVPVYATILAGSWCVILCLLFGLTELIDFMSIGQLIACVFVGMCVIKLRYKPFPTSGYEEVESTLPSGTIVIVGKRNEETTALLNDDDEPSSSTLPNNNSDFELTGTLKPSICKSWFAARFLSWTDRFEPGNVPVVSMFIASAIAAAALAMVLFGSEYLSEWWYATIFSLFCLIVLILVALMMLFVQDPTIETYKIPLSPLTPFISIVANTALMMKLHVLTWMRLGVWMSIGLILYFGYGYRHSKARHDKEISEEGEQMDMEELDGTESNDNETCGETANLPSNKNESLSKTLLVQGNASSME